MKELGNYIEKLDVFYYVIILTKILKKSAFNVLLTLV